MKFRIFQNEDQLVQTAFLNLKPQTRDSLYDSTTKINLKSLTEKSTKESMFRSFDFKFESTGLNLKLSPK